MEWYSPAFTFGVFAIGVTSLFLVRSCARGLCEVSLLSLYLRKKPVGHPRLEPGRKGTRKRRFHEKNRSPQGSPEGGRPKAPTKSSQKKRPLQKGGNVTRDGKPERPEKRGSRNQQKFQKGEKTQHQKQRSPKLSPDVLQHKQLQKGKGDPKPSARKETSPQDAPSKKRRTQSQKVSPTPKATLSDISSGPMRQLCNLGNTCYFNSFLQVFNIGFQNSDHLVQIPLGLCGSLLKLVTGPRAVPQKTLESLINSVSKKFPRYSIGKQQDPACLFQDLISADPQAFDFCMLKDQTHLYDCDKCGSTKTVPGSDTSIFVTSSDSGCFQTDIDDDCDLTDVCPNCFQYGARHRILYNKLPSVFFVQATMKYRDSMLTEKFQMLEGSSKKVFQMIGVSVQSGTPNGGHYVAMVKGKNDQWYLCNDATVQPRNTCDYTTAKLFAFKEV